MLFRSPVWVESIEAGLAAAKSRNQALMVALNMDKERGNQQMVDEVYPSPEFHEAAKHCVIAVASMFEHPKKTGAGGATVCARFGSVTCAQHRAIEKTVRADWLKRGPKDDIESPRHIFVSPDGKILFQRVWTMDAPTLAALMVRASELCTPERLAKWDTIDGRLERATDPIAAIREIAVAELVAANDPAVDERLMKLAKTTTVPAVAGTIYAGFVAATTPERRKLGQAGLGDKLPEVRLQVAHALEKTGAVEHIAVLLAQAAKEKDDRARGEMYRALGVLGIVGEKDAHVEKLLLKAVGSTKDGARAHAAIAIAPWAADAAVKTELSKILIQGDSQSVRSAAAWALGYSADPAIADELTKIHDGLTLRDWRVRMTIESAQAKLAGRPAPGYDAAPAYFLPHPADGDPPSDDFRGGK